MDAVSEWIYRALLGLVGVCVGSLLNVIIHRVPLILQGNAPRRVSLWFPGSFCPRCEKALMPGDNIPLVSWIILRGRCRWCREPISRQYPATEAMTMLLTLLTASLLPAGPLLVAAVLLGWWLLALALIDGMHFLLPDCLTLSLLWLGLLCHLGGIVPSVTLAQGVAGAATGYSVFRGLAWIYKSLSGEEGLGRGDAKLLAAGGVWLGWQALPAVLLLASLGGLMTFTVARLWLRRPLSAPVPFGPALSIAIWLLFIWQNR